MLDTSSNWRWRVQCRGLSCLDASSCSSTPGLCCPRYSLSNASLGAVFLMCVLIVVSSWTAALMFPVHPPVAHRCWASGCCSRGGPLMYCLELFCLYIWDQQGTRLAQWRFLLFFPCRWLLQNISLFFLFFLTYLWPPHALYLPEGSRGSCGCPPYLGCSHLLQSNYFSPDYTFSFAHCTLVESESFYQYLHPYLSSIQWVSAPGNGCQPSNE